METVYIAIDNSGSTHGNQFYHGHVKSIVKAYANSVVFFWSDVLKVLTKEEFEYENAILSGWGKTVPRIVVDFCLQQGFSGKLILITDGSIPKAQVNELDNFIESNGITLSFVQCYLIQTSKKKLDASVISPFISRFPNSIDFLNQYGSNGQNLLANGYSKQSLVEDMAKISTIDAFESRFDFLFSQIVSKMLGKDIDMDLRRSVLNIQKRLLYSMKAPVIKDQSERILALLDSGKTKDALEFGSRIFQEYEFKYNNIDWPSKLFHLLRMTTGSLKSVYSISAIKSSYAADRVDRAHVEEHFLVSEADNNEGNGTLFECPILYEESSDCVLLIAGLEEPILKLVGDEIANDIIQNPLNALAYPEAIQKIIQCIDHPVSLLSMKSAEDTGKPITVSPFTRRTLMGGLCLSPCDSHVKASNYTISIIASGGKVAGMSDLWFALIWYLIETHKDLRYLENILPQIREAMIYRLRTAKATATMTMLPFNCITTLPLGAAIWTLLNMQHFEPMPQSAYGIIRSHIKIIPVYIRLMELIGFQGTENNYAFLKRFSIYQFLNQNVKKAKTRELAAAHAITNKVIIIDRKNVSTKPFPFIVSMIPIDGPPSPEMREKAMQLFPFCYRELTDDDFRIAITHVLCRRNNNLNTSLNSLAPYNIVNWHYGLDPFKMPTIKICPTTCRPYLKDPQTGQNWKSQSKSVFGDLSNQANVHNWFIRYAKRYNTLPNQDTFIQYLYHNLTPKHGTLPAQTIQFVETVLSGYGEILTQIPENEVVRKIKRSDNLMIRERIESGDIE